MKFYCHPTQLVDHAHEVSWSLLRKSLYFRLSVFRYLQPVFIAKILRFYYIVIQYVRNYKLSIRTSLDVWTERVARYWWIGFLVIAPLELDQSDNRLHNHVIVEFCTI